MSHYRAGQEFAYLVRDALNADGYRTATLAASKGPADIWAVKPDQILFVQVKKTNPQLSPKERAALYELAIHCRGGNREVLPIVAYQPAPRKPIMYRLLTGIGPGDWEPWTPDEVAAIA
jgi:hypothetical protein